LLLILSDKTMSNSEKTEKPNPCRWLDPSEKSLPPIATPPGQDNRSESTKARNTIPRLEEPVTAGLLTLPEKEYWMNRIEKRIEQHVEAICAREPQFLERLQQESRQRALTTLGLLAWQTEWDAIEQQKAKLEIRRRQIERSMLAHVRGVRAKDIDDYENYRHSREIEQAIKRRQSVHQDELLAESETGQLILKLKVGKENLVDAVMLATSSEQVQKLWPRVGELLNDSGTWRQQESRTIFTEENE
jgi:hypothetical protein